METRANHLWVGAVTLVLLAALAAFIIWIARLGQGQQDEYDIFYGQSVSGLANGSQVSFAGVPVGQVTEIALAKGNPEFVRVRIKVKDDVPILVGTRATIEASFTGVSTILLDGARKGAPEITCKTTACPEGRPVIPPGRGGFGEIVANAPLLLERLATLTEQLNTILGPENQQEIAGILRNTNRLSSGLADATPALVANLEEFQTTLQEFNQTLDSIEQLTLTTEKLVNDEGKPLAAELRATLRSANAAATSLAATLEDTRPAARQLRESTLPNAEATLQDLRATSRALRSITEKLESEGAGALVGGKALPDYKP
ncbi:MlaD family protein [Erythrobacter dokdonensis]|jgi:phospholipid/cholesterol/gamma-HCH transport system substrate-binding protein|uniref:ABC-type transport system periplasmic component n=1 Tax=Erythrobacter dokdonensis DSW-74 TaxID=1300349 RepID=A0A1A7BD06_9SPHN|nr:MlaD family protein [Erythrobacter dokdonensis]MEE4317641.1 MlaD family protein [Erythrobacter sp.]OBV10374.1 ABC-type transport system periplasmic component [Erythrobacter dokdonensis DSW-74]